MSPKVNGLAVLIRLLGGHPLDFVALMSSISAVMGPPGLCDYAAANAVLDAFAESEDCPVVVAQRCRVRLGVRGGTSAWRRISPPRSRGVRQQEIAQIGNTHVRRRRDILSRARGGVAAGRRGPL